MSTGRTLLLVTILAGCWFNTASAAGQGAVGTFQTPIRSGAIKFIAVKRVQQWNGYQGTLKIAGRSYPAVMYGIQASGQVGFVWYYPNDYAQAGQAVLSLAPDGTDSGPMDFMNHRGVITESGTMTVQVTF